MAAREWGAGRFQSIEAKYRVVLERGDGIWMGWIAGDQTPNYPYPVYHAKVLSVRSQHGEKQGDDNY